MARRRSRRRSRRRAPLGAALLLLLIVVLVGALAQHVLRELPLDGFGGAPDDGRTAPLPPPTNGTLRLHYVDVGQGDAAVWELPDGSLVVFDCGPAAESPETNPVVRYIVDKLGRAPGSSLAALVASHGHLDHIGGCDEVFDSFRIERVYETWYDGADAPRSYARFQEKIRAEGAIVHTLGATDALEGELPLGDTLVLPATAAAAGVRAEFLWPVREANRWDEIANHGIVVRLVFGASTACFQGDIELREEGALLESGRDVSCGVYLVGHHGSQYASSPGWLAAMDPEVAVVSFGTNPYGHPTPEALCRVQESGATVYATARAGHVVVTLDGERAVVAPETAAETVDYCAPGASYW